MGAVREELKFDWPGPKPRRPFLQAFSVIWGQHWAKIRRDRLRLRVLHSTAGMIFKEVCIRYLEFSVGKIKPFT